MFSFPAPPSTVIEVKAHNKKSSLGLVFLRRGSVDGRVFAGSVRRRAFRGLT